MSTKSDALKRAIAAVSKAETLANELGITPQALSQWETVPPLRVLDVERITGVSRHELRPDLYPIASSSPEAA